MVSVAGPVAGLGAAGDDAGAGRREISFGRRDAIDRVRRQRGRRRVALDLLGGEHPIAARQEVALRLRLGIGGRAIGGRREFAIEHDRRGLLALADGGALVVPLAQGRPFDPSHSRAPGR